MTPVARRTGSLTKPSIDIKYIITRGKGVRCAKKSITAAEEQTPKSRKTPRTSIGERIARDRYLCSLTFLISAMVQRLNL